MFSYIMITATLASLFTAACCTGKKAAQPSGTATVNTATTSVTEDIPYQVANRYFFRNDAALSSLTDPRIFSREQFDLLFGAAPVMGKEGKPTVIDFSSSYVIALVSPPVNRLNEFRVQSLKKEAGKIILRYRVQEGKEISSTIQPLLLLIVNKSQQGELLLKQD